MVHVAGFSGSGSGMQWNSVCIECALAHTVSIGSGSFDWYTTS